MKVIKYDKRYKDDFIQLNITWIKKYFTMEKEDCEVLNHVEDWLEKGAMIFFAIEDHHVLGTCMIIPCGNDTWEICKLAANEEYQGKGAGSAVFEACMNYAINHRAKKLTLVSNHILKQALHIYEKFGFIQVPVTRQNEYERCDVQYEYIVGV